jgi:hypothetical protein
MINPSTRADHLIATIAALFPSLSAIMEPSLSAGPEHSEFKRHLRAVRSATLDLVPSTCASEWAQWARRARSKSSPQNMRNLR